MKRLICFTVLVCLFAAPLGIGAYASGASPTAGTIATSGADLKVRSGASASHGVMGTLPSGSIIMLYEQKGGWWRVGLPGGQYGYCASGYIKQVSGSAARQVAAAALNVRSGPSKSHPAQGRLSQGAVVVALSTSGSFARIVYDGNKTGYVSAAYLKPLGGSTASAARYAAISLNVPNYKQTDSRWARLMIGNSQKTIGSIGCAITSLAMTESYRTGSAITPDMMQKRLSYNSTGALYWPGNYLLPGSISYSQLYQKLKDNVPVIVGARKADGGTHFVVIKGYVGGNSLTASGFTINDPGSSTRTRLSQFLSVYPKLYRRAYYAK
jgi:uncharacterized protein YraI